MHYVRPFFSRLWTVVFSCFLFNGSVFTQEYSYETVMNDPLRARIYTLQNGLKVYLSVYKAEPRIQTYIAVKAGGKYDPAHATGLAHYLEHMLFKGTDRFGTTNYEEESKLIDRIMNLFEQLRETSEESVRKEIYASIDALSQEAAHYAIPNEYDKMLSFIGAEGTNAYTSKESTVYKNTIPSNELERWLNIEAERFRNPILRLFHTELETVYEEKNRDLDDDNDKLRNEMLAALFPTHQYGTQTLIGTIDHLKNPSMKAVLEYYFTYYVPNNMAICLSGDLDPDETIRLIDSTFGKFEAKPLPKYDPPREEPIEKPIVRQVWGPDSTKVWLAFRCGGVGTRDADMLVLIKEILSNGVAGLLDLNLNQPQKVLAAGAGSFIQNDYSAFILEALPREKQTLEQAQALLLDQIALLKMGEFPDWLLPAIINELKIKQTKHFEKLSKRAHAFVDAFCQNQSWQEYIFTIDRLSKITKQEVIQFARDHFQENYVTVYKRTGEDPDALHVEKPLISPLLLNREEQSEFAESILNMPSSTIDPVFVDYDREIAHFTYRGVNVSQVQNRENDLFQLVFVQDRGRNSDRRIGIALDLLYFLGTSELSAAQFKQELYKTGCSLSTWCSEDQIQVALTGLQPNLKAGCQLLKQLFLKAKPNDEALSSVVSNIIKRRSNEKLSKKAILGKGLYHYAMYGPHSPYTNVLSEEELRALTCEELIDIIRGLRTYPHRMLYYGPADQSELEEVLSIFYPKEMGFEPLPLPLSFQQQQTNQTQLFFVDYDMEQVEMMMLSKSEPFNPNNMAVRQLFNEYFGGGMSSLAFTTIRESKALAYSVAARYITPPRKELSHYIYAYIGTQADKLPEALASMMDLVHSLPHSDLLFQQAKEGLLKFYQTDRIRRSALLSNCEYWKKMGLRHNPRKEVYEKIPELQFNDLYRFHQQYIKGKEYHIVLIGDKSKIDWDALSHYGKVTELSLEEIFGY